MHLSDEFDASVCFVAIKTLSLQRVLSKTLQITRTV